MSRFRGLLLGATVVWLAVGAPTQGMRSAAADLPRLVFWAWERPEDLRSLPRDVGVAFLAQTVSIEPTRVRIDPRRQSLRVADDTVLIAVTRVEFPNTRPLEIDDLERIAAAIARTAGLPRVKAIQIDFDATVSQRELYRRLLTRVRDVLDRQIPLSMTALASWCAGDPWLDGLPVAEAVPMLFELGPVNEPFRELAMSTSASHAACRDAVGIALNEPLPFEPRGRRVYVFSHQGWSAAAIAAAMHEAVGHGVSR